MKKSILSKVMLAISFLLSASTAVRAQEMPGDYQEVLKTPDRKGDFKSGVLKVNIPRNDLKIAVAGVATPTPFGFGGWVALTKGTDGTDVMMGDLVQTQEKVNPVMSALLGNGIDVTALPQVYFMHVHGMGKAADLADQIQRGLCPLLGRGTGDGKTCENCGSCGRTDRARL